MKYFLLIPIFVFLPLVWRWYVNRPHKRKTCWVYCDCGNELTANGDLVSDDIYVTYSCSECGEGSEWDFDRPAPIRINR